MSEIVVRPVGEVPDALMGLVKTTEQLKEQHRRQEELLEQLFDVAAFKVLLGDDFDPECGYKSGLVPLHGGRIKIKDVLLEITRCPKDGGDNTHFHFRANEVPRELIKPNCVLNFCEIMRGVWSGHTKRDFAKQFGVRYMGF